MSISVSHRLFEERIVPLYRLGICVVEYDSFFFWIPSHAEHVVEKLHFSTLERCIYKYICYSCERKIVYSILV